VGKDFQRCGWERAVGGEGWKKRAKKKNTGGRAFRVVFEQNKSKENKEAVKTGKGNWVAVGCLKDPKKMGEDDGGAHPNGPTRPGVAKVGDKRPFQGVEKKQLMKTQNRRGKSPTCLGFGGVGCGWGESLSNPPRTPKKQQTGGGKEEKKYNPPKKNKRPIQKNHKHERRGFAHKQKRNKKKVPRRGRQTCLYCRCKKQNQKKFGGAQETIQHGKSKRKTSQTTPPKTPKGQPLTGCKIVTF